MILENITLNKEELEEKPNELATKMFTRVETEIKLSDFLKEIINISDYDYHKYDTSDYSISFERSYPEEDILKDYYKVEVSFPNKNHSFAATIKTFEDKREMTISNLPDTKQNYQRVMVFSLENGGTLKLPFVKDILADPFAVYLARLILADTIIIFDVDDFHDDLFPELDNCHC
jgi:hypothetical protein